LLHFTPFPNKITPQSIGVDLELAQVKGACLSFAETNEPEYSKIVVNDVDELAAYFIRACYAHGKRGI
jgi:hypothetical protein